MAGRFNLWLGREGRGGRIYSQEQLGWLEAIRDYLAANIEVTKGATSRRTSPRKAASWARGGLSGRGWMTYSTTCRTRWLREGFRGVGLARGRAKPAGGRPIAGPWALPVGWRWEQLGDIGTWSGGGTPSKAKPEFWSNGNHSMGIAQGHETGCHRQHGRSHHLAAVAGSSTKLVAAGSVLCVMRSGILRHTFPVAVAAGRCDAESGHASAHAATSDRSIFSSLLSSLHRPDSARNFV